jgi:hypothetical protein
MNEETKVIEEVIEEVAETNACSGKNFGLAMLIGSGLTIATIAVVKKVKKVIADKKALKEQPFVVENSYDNDREDEDFDS